MGDVSKVTPAPLRFETVLVGTSMVELDGRRFESEVRVLLGSDGAYRLLGGALSEPVPSLAAAVALVEEAAVQPGARREVRWRVDGAAPGENEGPCPVCGAPVVLSPRYPRQLCRACVLEAADANGRALRFGNTCFGGGFEARYADDRTPYASDECFVRGLRCQAGEHRFGGIVVQLLAGERGADPAGE